MKMPNWLRRIWYGRYHITLARQITGEETIQITFSETTAGAFQARIAMVLSTLRNHMIEHNERVILAFRSRIDDLTKQIEAKEKELNDLNNKIARRSLGPR